MSPAAVDPCQVLRDAIFVGQQTRRWEAVRTGSALAAWQYLQAVRPDEVEHLMAQLPTAEIVALERCLVPAPSDAPIPEYASFADLDENPPEPRRFVVDQWLPRGVVGGLFAAGGVGKSLLSQQWATCVANGLPVLGHRTAMGAVLGFFCEDDANELRRRQRAILAHLRRSARDSSAGLFLEGRAGELNTLIAFDAQRNVLRTPFLDLVEREVERLRPALLILDNIAQLYAGLENDRFEVTMFVNLLTGIARRFDCSVLLLGHVAKLAGSEYSGSTAWEAALRVRLWIERRDDGVVELHRRKANYSSLDRVSLEYRDGAFAEVDDAAVGAAGSQAAAQAEAVVLDALDTFTAREVATSQVPTARTFLPRLAAREGLLNGCSEVAAGRALAALIDRGELVVGQPLGWRKPDRKPALGLMRRQLPI